jgi:hypothetical protein
MFSDSSDEFLNNIYKRFSSQHPVPSSLSPQIRKRLSQFDDLGLISHRGALSPASIMRTAKKACSIKIAEFFSPKLRKSMIDKVGIPKFLEDMKKSQNHDKTMKNSASYNSLQFEQKTGKPSQTERFNPVNVCSQRKKSHIKEINPLFFLRINEVMQKSRQLVAKSQKFGSQVERIKKKHSGKLKKQDRVKIENNLKLIV